MKDEVIKYSKYEWVEGDFELIQFWIVKNPVDKMCVIKKEDYEKGIFRWNL